MNQRRRSLVAVILLIVVSGGCTNMGSKDEGTRFETLSAERQEMEALVGELASMLGVDVDGLEATQRECVGPTSGDKERVDLNLVVEVEAAASTIARDEVEQALQDRGWKTERSSSATTEDIFATRNGADLTVSTFINPTRVSISGSTTCHHV